jgi:hypothetical protein
MNLDEPRQANMQVEMIQNVNQNSSNGRINSHIPYVPPNQCHMFILPNLQSFE